MPTDIDESKVQWDETPQIDESKVQWDAAPSQPHEEGWGEYLGHEALGAARGLRRGIPFAEDVGAAIKSGSINPWSPEFQEGKKKVIAEREKAYEETPMAYGAGMVGGLAAPMVLTAGAAAPAELGMAANIGRTALTGAGSSAVYGLGEGVTPEERLENAKTAALVGGGLGAAAPIVGAGIQKVAEPITKGFKKAFPGFVSGAEKSATARIAEEAAADRAVGKGLTKTEIDEALARGQDVRPIDVGGESLISDVKSIANKNPEFAAKVKTGAEERFLGQQDRYTNYLENLAGHKLNADDLASQMRDTARKANQPAYESAYANAPKVLYDERLKELANSPAIKKVIGKAQEKAENIAAAEGKAVPASYSLEFWDNVKRSLDDRIGALNRKGNYDKARDTLAIKNKLLSHLDNVSEDYKKARQGAATFFGEDNAYDAGLNFLGKTKALNTSQAKNAYSKMKPNEQEVFRSGMLQDLMQKINKPKVTEDVTKLFGSPETRQKLEMVLGPERTRELEAFTKVEQLIGYTHRALQGQSSTAQQLSRMGAAVEGIGKGFKEAGLPVAGLALEGFGGFGAGFLAKQALSHLSDVLGKNQAAAMANKLMSQDPNAINEVMQVISSNPRAMKKLDTILKSLAYYAGPQAARSSADQRRGRASGGKIDYPAKKLNRMEKALARAQKALAEETKPLMEIPDDQVAHALEMAKNK